MIQSNGAVAPKISTQPFDATAVTKRDDPSEHRDPSEHALDAPF